MRKVLFVLSLILSFSIIACNPKTTVPSTEPTSDNATEVTTIISEEIYLKLNPGVDTVEINSIWVDAGAVFVLNDVEFAMVTDDSLDMTFLGYQVIIYFYTYQGEEYSITRYVMVTDQTLPILELNAGIDTIKVGETWIDAGVTVSDNSGEVLTYEVSGLVDTNTAGTY